MRGPAGGGPGRGAVYDRARLGAPVPGRGARSWGWRSRRWRSSWAGRRSAPAAEAGRFALAAIGAAFDAAAGPAGMGGLGAWRFASAVTGGRLIAANTDLALARGRQTAFHASCPAMTGVRRRTTMDHEQQEQIALHRWAVIAEAAGDRLTAGGAGGAGPADRRPRAHPPGRVVPHATRGARSTGGCGRGAPAGWTALKPAPRADTGVVRAHPELFAEAAALRLELPGRSAAQIASILYHRHGITVSERTVRGQLRRRRAAPRGAGRRAEGLRPVRGRPAERAVDHRRAGRPVGALAPGRDGSVRARLFLIVDDHSRLLVDGRFFAHENARACQELLRRAITRRGLPEVFYADNGAPFSNAWLARTCGVLGIRLVHSKPYSPEGRGKQERLNRYIREAFLAEAVHHGIESLDALNDLFAAWAGQVANRRVHAETGQAPIGRFEAGGPPAAGQPGPAARGVPLVGDPPGHPHRDRPAGGKRLRRGPGAGRPAGRAAVRPRGPDPASRCSWTASPPGPRPRSSPAGTCTAPSRRPPARTRTRPGSTTSAWSPPRTRTPPAPEPRSTSPPLGRLTGSEPGQDQEPGQEEQR